MLMATYDHKQVLADYANNKITSEMATGHALQHIGLLYDGQSEAKAGRLAQQSQLEQLDQRVATLQTAVDRLTAFMEKVQRTQKKRTKQNQPQSD
jgi:uncharacterized small protein (DUF1192 family)